MGPLENVTTTAAAATVAALGAQGDATSKVASALAGVLERVMEKVVNVTHSASAENMTTEEARRMASAYVYTLR